jgi:lipopolysaccharide/colanic/teichoic acid biosynthesis glycosyltransferase
MSLPEQVQVSRTHERERVTVPRSKRWLDLVVTIPILACCAPFMVIIAALVKLTSKGPALFRQQRIGRDDEPFEMLKFRSMVVNNDDSALREAVRLELAGSRAGEAGDSYKLSDDPRITRVGRFIRATSIDELPQLLNVVRGEMSLVGPRPALPWEAVQFPPEFRHRTEVPPGITGLWQVSGRSMLSTLDMLALDAAYIENWSLGLDMRILLRTLPALLRGDGAR